MPDLRIFDLVEVTTTTTGTGTLTLGAATAGRRTPTAAGYSAGECMPYRVATADGATWEVGIGTLATLGTLERTVVLASSNADALVNLPAGTHTVSVVYPASLSIAQGVTAVMDAWPPFADDGAIAIGCGASADPNSTVIGYSADAQADSVVVGHNSTAGSGAVVVGWDAGASGGAAVAVGYNASAAANAVAVGYNAAGTGTSSIVIGNAASSAVSDSIAIGYSAEATVGSYSVALGHTAKTQQGNAVALGWNALAKSNGSVAWQGATAEKCAVEVRKGQTNASTLIWSGGRSATAGATTIIDTGNANFRMQGTAGMVAIDLLVIGARSTGACYAARITACVRWNGTAVTILGTPTTTVIYDSTGGAASAAIAAGSTDNLLINVNNGDGANPWNWSARLNAAAVAV